MSIILTPIQVLRETLQFGPLLTDDQVVNLVIERLNDLVTENYKMKELFEKLYVIEGN